MNQNNTMTGEKINLIYTVLIVVAAIACAISLYASISIMRKQQNQKRDHIHETVAKHPIAANPIVILYVALPVLVIIGALVWWYLDIKGLT